MTQISLESQQQERTQFSNNDVISDIINGSQVSACVSIIVFSRHFCSQYNFLVVLTNDLLLELSKKRLKTNQNKQGVFWPDLENL